MQIVDQLREEVVTNYYTGEKWFLVNINGSETYISETRYHKMEKDKTIRLKPSFS